MAVSGAFAQASAAVLAAGGDIRAPEEIFRRIFIVFLGLGTLVGVVVITYTLYNAYKYRYREGEDPAPDADRPELGEIPESGGKGKKLFLSFGMSALIVLSLVAWTYGALVTIENKPQQVDSGEMLEVDVTGGQFYWQFTYPNGHTTQTLRVPVDRMVQLNVTSADVMHNFGIPGLRVKADAIPGQTTSAWFVAEKTGRHMAHCYELCGTGHSNMDAEVIVLSQEEYQDWYAGTNSSSSAGSGNASAASGTAANGTTATDSAPQAVSAPTAEVTP